MGSSDIWDKYHECCIGIGKNFTRSSRVKYMPISNTIRVVQIFTAIPLLFHVNTIPVDFYWCLQACDVQIALLKHMLH